MIGQRVQTDGQRRWVAGIYDQPDIREPGRKSIATHPGLLSYASLSGKIFDRGLTDGLAFEGRVLGDQPWAIRALLRAGDGIVVIDDVVYEWWRPHPRTSGRPSPAARSTPPSAPRRWSRSPGRAWTAVAAEADVQLGDEARARQSASPTSTGSSGRTWVGRCGRPSRGATRPRPSCCSGSGALLEGLPRDVVAASTALGDTILLPPLRGWRRLDGAAHAAYRTMLRPALRADPLVLAEAVWRRLPAGRARPAGSTSTDRAAAGQARPARPAPRASSQSATMAAIRGPAWPSHSGGPSAGVGTVAGEDLVEGGRDGLRRDQPVGAVGDRHRSLGVGPHGQAGHAEDRSSPPGSRPSR